MTEKSRHSKDHPGSTTPTRIFFAKDTKVNGVTVQEDIFLANGALANFLATGRIEYSGSQTPQIQAAMETAGAVTETLLLSDGQEHVTVGVEGNMGEAFVSDLIDEPEGCAQGGLADEAQSDDDDIYIEGIDAKGRIEFVEEDIHIEGIDAKGRIELVED